MDHGNREDGISYDALLPGPPTLSECMLDFGHVERGSRKTLQQIIANTTPQPMIWLGHTDKARWITLEPDHGILQPGERQSIRVTADTRVLAVGEHCVMLAFSSEGDEASASRNMFTKVKVEEVFMPQEPSSTALPLQAGLHLGWLTPQSTSTMGLVISNPDSRAIEWEIQAANGASQMGKKVALDHFEQPDGHWQDFSSGQNQGIILNPSPMKGTLGPGQSATVYVTASSKELESETFYTTNLTLTSRAADAANAPATSVQVPVSFYVSVHPYDDGGPKCPVGVPPSPGTSVTIPPSQNQGQATLRFKNGRDNTKVYWQFNLDPGIDWLKVDPPSGSYDPGKSSTVKLIATRGNLDPGTYTTSLRITLSYNASMSPANNILQPIPVTVIVK